MVVPVLELATFSDNKRALRRGLNRGIVAAALRARLAFLECEPARERAVREYIGIQRFALIDGRAGRGVLAKYHSSIPEVNSCIVRNVTSTLFRAPDRLTYRATYRR